MLVDEIMVKNPETINPDGTIREALEKLLELNARHLPVVSKGELIGIISDRDLGALSFEAVTQSSDPRTQLDKKVRTLMHSDVISVELGTDVGEVIEMLLETKVGALPVVDGHTNRIVSYIDVLKAARPFFG